MDKDEKELLLSLASSMAKIENTLDAILLRMVSRSEEDSYVGITQKGYASFCEYLKASSFARDFQEAEQQEMRLRELERLPHDVDMTRDFWEGGSESAETNRTFGDFAKQLSVKYGFPKGNRNLNTRVRKIIYSASLDGSLKLTGQIAKYLKAEGFREANKVVLDRYSANLVYLLFNRSGALDEGKR